MDSLRVPVVRSKLRPQALPSIVVLRHRYREMSQLLSSARVTRVIAPGGYGKTTFLAAAASAADRVRPAFSWYALDEFDGDISVFLSHFIAAVGQALPGFGQATRDALSGIPDLEKQYGIAAAAFAEELWQRGLGSQAELVAVLDDYHSVENSGPVNSVMEYLLLNSPPGVHYCISSRRQIPLRLERLALQGQVRSVGPEDLVLDAQEIGEVLAKVTEARWSPESVQEVAASTEGWPAGVVLIGQSLRGGGTLESAKMVKSLDKEATFRYFAEEVYGRLDESARGFLADAALLRSLTPDACDAVLGIEDSKDRLENALEKGLFLTATEVDGKRIYRFHQIFRSFLEKNTSVERVRKIHAGAANYYENQGMLDEAMAHYLDASLADQAAMLLVKQGQDLIDEGRVDQLRRWLNALPKETLDGSPRLLYYMGFAYQNSDAPKALDCLDRAAQGLAEDGDLPLRVRALIYMATIYSLQNNIDKVKEVSSRIPVIAAMRKDPWSRGVLTVSALCQAAWDDNLKRGVFLSKIARRLPLDPDWQWALLAYSCMIYYRLGDLDTSQTLIEEGLKLPVVQRNDNWLGLGLILHHVTLYCQDKDKEASPVREDLWNLGEKYGSDYYKAYAERARAFSPYQRGRLEEGKALLKSSLHFFEKAGNMGMAALTRLDLAMLECSFGNAGEVLDESRRALADLFSLNPGQGLEEIGESIFGAVAREAGDFASAESHLLHSASVSRRKGAKQILAGTYLHVADLYASQGDDSRADDYLRKGIGLASRNRYTVFWDLYRPTVLRLCIRGVARGIHPEYAEYLLRYWFGEQAASQVQKAAARATDAKRAALYGVASRLKAQGFPLAESGPRSVDAAGEVSATAAAAPSPALDIRLLGKLEVFVEGDPVPEKAWQTRKVKSLFKYLVLNRSRRVSREELMDLFWPDSDPAAASASLRVSLSRLRRALSHPRYPGVSPIASDEGGRVWFLPGDVCELDADRFEDAVNTGYSALKDGNSREAARRFEDAVSVYQGDFLEEDLYEDWPAAERERLRLMFLNSLLALARIYLENSPSDFERASAVLLKALAANPFREETYLALMQAYAFRGQAVEALRVFERCKKMLSDEFGVKPSRAMLELAADIKARSGGQ